MLQYKSKYEGPEMDQLLDKIKFFDPESLEHREVAELREDLTNFITTHQNDVSALSNANQMLLEEFARLIDEINGEIV